MINAVQKEGVAEEFRWRLQVAAPIITAGVLEPWPQVLVRLMTQAEGGVSLDASVQRGLLVLLANPLPRSSFM